MISVRLHVQAGTVWALCKCSGCGEIHKYTIRDAVAAPIACKQCGHRMDIKGAVIEAVDRMPGAPGTSGDPGGSPSSNKPSHRRKPTSDDGGQHALRR